MRRWAPRILTLIGLSVVAFCIAAPGTDGQQAPVDNPLADWRPLQTVSGIRYVGSSKCATCHRVQALSQVETPMAHALEFAAECGVLSAHPRMSFQDGPYSYSITREGNRSVLTVSDGSRSITEPILYCFGQGRGGQTYVVKHNGTLIEVRVSYYTKPDRLDFTIGQRRAAPSSLEEALGRELSQTEATDCFGCHAPMSVSGSELNLEKFVPGVTCESCHGPGEKHLAAVSRGAAKNLQIFSPKGLDANSISQEFCGTCHRSFDQVMLMPDRGGFQNVRFQPYRIFNSRGHNKLDPRAGCTACHDPHRKVEHQASFYDAKCLSCHLSDAKEPKTAKRSASACPVRMLV